MPIHCLDVGIDASAVVEMESSEVQLPDITSIIHVTEENVHILGRTDTWNMAGGNI